MAVLPLISIFSMGESHECKCTVSPSRWQRTTNTRHYNIIKGFASVECALRNDINAYLLPIRVQPRRGVGIYSCGVPTSYEYQHQQISRRTHFREREISASFDLWLREAFFHVCDPQAFLLLLRTLPRRAGRHSPDTGTRI